jgi:hypothetical protein
VFVRKSNDTNKEAWKATKIAHNDEKQRCCPDHSNKHDDEENDNDKNRYDNHDDNDENEHVNDDKNQNASVPTFFTPLRTGNLYPLF